MAKLILQFHARRDEVARLVATWVNESGLWLAYETLTPTYGNALVAEGSLKRDLEIPPSVNRLVLSLYPINMEAVRPFGLIQNNGTALTILLGGEDKTMLGESVLQAMTNDSRALSEWKRLRKAMMSSFRKGARVVNSSTGAIDNADGHYFSPGAEVLLARGVRMAGMTGLLSYELG